jgi:alpha-L-rhamnosidase
MKSYSIKSFLFCCIFIFAGLFNGTCLASTLKPVHLTCEYVINPLGIDTRQPLLAWQVESSARGGRQIAYQIIVSDNKADMQKDKGNVWTSVKVKSSACNNIVYAGKKLSSSTRYYWKVRIYSDQSISDWSDMAFFETSLLSQQEWTAKWIGDGSSAPQKVEDFYNDDPAPIFRKVCTMKRAVASARLYITGLGYYEAYINGKRVGNSHLDPGWTDYKQTVLFSTYDVTSLLNSGSNVLGFWVGNGFYNPLPFRIFTEQRKFLTIGRPKVRAQLLVKYTDGSKETFNTDTSWRVLYSPIMKNNVYLGETYDARKEIAGWEKSDFDVSSYKNAVLTSDPGGRMTAEIQPPIRETKVLKPTRMTEPRTGVFVFDMGQNFAGVARLKVKGPRGTKITIRYGEEVYSDASLNGITAVGGNTKKIWDADRSIKGSPQTAWQEDTYILKGNGGTEVWQPRFTFHGFRYVELTGFPGRPTLDNIEGIRMCSDIQKVGNFTCSDQLINKIETAVEWTFLSNVFSLQSDCPHREKLGYGGDEACTLDSYCYLFDMSTFHQNTVRNFREARRPSGAMTETAPFVGIADNGFGGGSGPIGWQLAYCLTQKKLYDFYGNKRIIAENYDIFKKQVEFIRAHAKDNLIDKHNCLGDHEALDPETSSHTNMETRCIPVSATAHYYRHVMLLAEFAKLLNKQEDYRTYSNLAEDIKASFIKNFYNPETGIVGNGTQTTQCFALFYQLYPEGAKEKIFNQLINSIKATNNHIYTGMFSTSMILNLLSENGRSDLAYTLVTRRDYPGWGYMIDKGATTIWETWEYFDIVYSHNHPMFGSINDWFYKSLLGIHSTSPGFETITISPKPTDKLTWAKGSYESIRGKISVSWKNENKHFSMDVTIPFGVKAEIRIPNAENKDILEGGKKLSDVEGISNIKYENRCTVINAVSGSYSFN